MCGLAGLFSPRIKDAIRFEPAMIDRMTDIIAHRGPDEGGSHIEPHVALGHRRLSIIDVATGQQPLFNEDNSVVVVFNGEIYNFQSLVTELEACGHRFRTRSDTEVIVHGWEQWGVACVERFRGMFAFSLWDRNKKTLFLARDRLGVKSMYYGFLPDGTLAFGSELKCLTALPEFPLRVDDNAVEDYLAFGYVPDPRTIYQNAYKLPSAHTLTFKVGDAAPSIRQYWDVRFEPDQKLSLADACAQVRERIAEAVKIRMISEVPLGAFLSGGVDSSFVVAAMAGVSSDPVKTCSIAFDVPQFDESRYARMVAERYKTDHYVETVGTEDFDLIDRLAGLYDEPFADSSALPTYRVCQLARKRVTVALSGDGGDETFGGYRRYKLHLMEEHMRQFLPLSVRRPVFGALGALYPKLDWMPRVFRAKTTFQAIARDSIQAYFHTMCVLRDDERSSLYSPAFRARLQGYNAIEVFRRHARTAPTDQPLALAQYLDYKTYLPEDINTKVDRASMAHSLEVREPLMDHQLIEWMARLPQSLKIGSGEQKFLLKKSAEPMLPDDVLYRPKMGFAVPLAQWLRGPLRAKVEASMKSEVLHARGIFQKDRLQKITSEHMSGRRDWSQALWAILCLERTLAAQSRLQ